ncbi:unnamed protein product [Paramecium pentaurelia]|uniref:Uncharacterized protein n=1 Tax=Paramecium pentaurelia TaxID=43138 RepID=A0A8S1UR66_9CILI|nr:unnamed protein product [Paramecium pentaurelia]
MKSLIPQTKKPGKSLPKSKDNQTNLSGNSKKEITNESNGFDISKQQKSSPNPIEQKRKQNCLFEIVELANTLKDDDKVNGLVFKQIIISIEAKLTEFQERLENRDNLQELNTHLQKLQNLQSSPYSPNGNQCNQKKDDSRNDTSGLLRNQSQMSLPQVDNASVLSAQEKIKSPQGRRSTSKQPTINLGVTSQQVIQENNKIAALEKRLRSNEDNYVKLSKEFQEQSNANNQKFEKTIKALNEKYLAYSTMNLQQQFNEITESQKALISHLHQQSKEISEFNNGLNQLKQSQDAQIIEVLNKIEHALQQNNENFVRIQSLSSSLQAIDADFIVILKCYKDILNEIFKIDLLEQQQKKIVCLLQDEQ